MLGVCGADPKRELQKGATAECPVPLGFVPPSHPVRLQERGRLLLRSLRHRAQNLEGAAQHRCGLH